MRLSQRHYSTKFWLVFYSIDVDSRLHQILQAFWHRNIQQLKEIAMAGYYSVWRFSRTTLAILLATACSAQLALGQYTYVQDTDGAGSWSDVLNWDTDNDPN